MKSRLEILEVIPTNAVFEICFEMVVASAGRRLTDLAVVLRAVVSFTPGGNCAERQAV